MTYEQACKLRTLAEMSREPEMFRRAAEAFRELGMLAAAGAMVSRAEWYEDRRAEKVTK